jgi:integrase
MSTDRTDRTDRTDLAVIETDPMAPAPAFWTAEPPQSAPFGFLYRDDPGAGHHWRQHWQGAWDAAIERWLHSGRRRTDNTRRSYRLSIITFRQYLRDAQGVYHLWQVADIHCQQWIAAMTAEGKSKRTIGARIAAVSSLYNYAIHTTAIIDGREISLFIDAWGSTRGNPFHGAAVERPVIAPFSDAAPVSGEAYAWIIHDLQHRQSSAGNLRNLALMLMFGLNGWRNEEVLTMTWGKLTKNTQRTGQYTYRWTGKARNGAEEKRPIPVPVHNAIVAYLKTAGRWRTIQPDDYIWQPLRTHGLANFANAAALPANTHIAQSTANEILRSQLRRYYRRLALTAGLDRADAATYASEHAARYSIHSLRHMFAWELYQGSNHDIDLVSKKLGHKSIATTQIYLQHLQEPEDDHSDLLARQLGLSF